MAGLANQLAVIERDEVALAIRVLLGRPLITRAADPESFEVIRRRQGPASMWFDYYLGWSLHVEPRIGYARLAKVPARPDASRPARRARSGNSPFDRRRYTLFALIAAELLATPQTVIGALAEKVRAACAADPALPAFDTARHGERVAFVDALMALESLGAVTAVDGLTESFTESEQAKVLYRVDTTLLLRLLAAPVGPSQAPDLDASDGVGPILERLLVESRYGTSAEPGGPDTERRNLRLRHRVLRMLFDDPVVYREDLAPAELAYATSITGRGLMRKAATEAGLILEERAEGWLVIDPTGTASDWRFPDDASTAKVAALLLIDRLNEVGGPIDAAQAQSVAAGRLAAHPNWARAYQTPDGAARLTAEAIGVLQAVGLVATADDGTLLRRPAAARYQVSTTGISTTGDATGDAPNGQPHPAPARRQAQRLPTQRRKAVNAADSPDQQGTATPTAEQVQDEPEALW